MGKLVLLLLLSGLVVIKSAPAQQAARILNKKVLPDTLLQKEYAKYATFEKEPELSKKEILYNDYIKSFPAGPDADNMRLDMVDAYLTAKKIQRLRAYHSDNRRS